MNQELTGVSKEIATSIEEVAVRQRGAGTSGMEVQNPGKAARILNALADGEPSRRIEREFRIGGSLLTRMRRDHFDVLSRSRQARAQAAAETADRARELLEKKIAQLAGDDGALAKANLKDLGITFGIATDKMQLLANDPTCITQHQPPKLTVQDALDAIATAKAEVETLHHWKEIRLGSSPPRAALRVLETRSFVEYTLSSGSCGLRLLYRFGHQHIIR